MVKPPRRRRIFPWQLGQYSPGVNRPQNPQGGNPPQAPPAPAASRIRQTLSASWQWWKGASQERAARRADIRRQKEAFKREYGIRAETETETRIKTERGLEYWWSTRFRRAWQIILKLAFLLFVIWVIVLFFSSDARDAVFTAVGTTADTLKLGKFYDATWGKLNRAWNEYVYGVSSWTPPDYAEGAEVEGVRDIAFKPLDPVIFEGEPIQLLGSAEIDPLGESVRTTSALVTFACSLDKKDGKEPVKGTLVVSGEDSDSVQVPTTTPAFRSFLCTLPPIDKIDATQAQRYVVNLDWHYEDFETVSRLKILTLDRTTRDAIRQRNQDPLKGFRDKYITSEGLATPICEQGCGFADAFLNIQADMPLVTTGDDSPYILSAGLTGIRLGPRKGDLKKLTSIQITLPQHVALVDTSCTKIGTDLTLDNRDAFLDAINKDLPTNEQDTFGFHCDIKPTITTETITPGFAAIRAIYDYGDRVERTITVQKEDTTL